MEQKAPRRRGRPPAFDRESVVAKAQRVFWREGPAGASLDSLAEATGLHKPSLYAAFGGKSGLYSAALDAYIESGAPDVRQALARAPLRKALEAFFEADLDVFCGPEDRRGCFLIGTAIEAAAGDPAIRVRIDAVLTGLRRTLGARIASAAAEGELAVADVEAATEIVYATHVMLAVEARAGTARVELRKRLGRILDLLDGLAGA
ncbi:MAG: TetR/AcrR family transcriptional regulator, copper-responsive repressor [Sphingomonadales bacterium]|jgi:AcrR family transcriptional regulator|nr:TetR/AcrR family transcriptional regulator, copper-responsive repressor [Sphingomonadales bacterium]